MDITKSFQRIHSLTKNIEQSEALIRAGFHSAIQIANHSKQEFVEAVSHLFKDNGSSAKEQAEAIHAGAVNRKSQAVLSYMNLVQQNEKHYKNARFANLTPDGSGLANLPSYNELFGNVDFCACESCRSIFSPAAYFVDLMRMQAKFITPNADYPAYDLKTRRPDLWNIELSCENTNTEVSKLEIVNEVLGGQLSALDNLPSGPAFYFPLNTDLQEATTNGLGKIKVIAEDDEVKFGPGITKSNDALLLNDQSKLSLVIDDKIDLSKGFTISFWFNATKSGELFLGFSDPLESKSTIPLLLFEVRDDLLDNNFKGNFEVMNTGAGPFYTPPIKNGSFYHLAICVQPKSSNADKDYLTTLYFNYNDSDPKNHFSHQIDIGNNEVNPFLMYFGGEGFSGSVSELVMYNSPLSEGDISKLAQAENYSNPEIELSTLPYPWSLPFNQALSAINKTLKAENKTFAGVWEDLQPNLFINRGLMSKADQLQAYYTPTYNLAQLGISVEQWQIMTHTLSDDTDHQILASYYGLESFKNTDLKDWKVTDFLKQTAMSRSELDELLSQNLSDLEIDLGYRSLFFVNIDGYDIFGPFDPLLNPSMLINKDKKGDEIIKNLSFGRLNNITRFVRLSNVLNWTYEELDWALRTIAFNLGLKTPVIDDSILPVLAWIKSWQNTSGWPVLSIAALFGPLKDCGVKNGPSFFEQVFNNPQIPDVPKWYDQPVWKVPQLGKPDTKASKNDKIIQTALATALHLSQYELIIIANAILSQNSISGQGLTLNKQNLALLYRLSKLPEVCGLSIQFCADKNVFDPVSSLFNQLGKYYDQNGSNFAPAKKKTTYIFSKNLLGLIGLQDFGNWVSQTQYPVDQLQYILTGKSSSKQLQNQIFGDDKINNFISATQKSIKPNLVNLTRFVHELNSLLSNKNLKTNAATLHQYLIDNKFLDTNGVVLTIPKASDLFTCLNVQPTQISGNQMASIKTALENISITGLDIVTAWDVLAGDGAIKPVEGSTACVVTNNSSIDDDLKDFTKDQIAQVHNILASAIALVNMPLAKSAPGLLSNHYQIQQHTYLKHLNGLFAIQEGVTRVLLEIVPLSLSALLQNNTTTDVSDALKLMQRYTQMFLSLSLSAAEAESLAKHSSSYDMVIPAVDGETFEFTFDNIRALYSFKKFIFDYKDTQNHFIHYLEWALENPKSSPETVAEKLCDITQWNQKELILLLQTLTAQKKGETIPFWAKMSGILTLHSWFEEAASLGIDIHSLQEVKQLLTEGDQPVYGDYALVSKVLWSGFQKVADKKTISHVQNSVNATKRDGLVPLVIHHLNLKNAGNSQWQTLKTPRDLYEYLLIDVEVEGVVQTSRVKSGISAVQLYIYRCLNNLEPDAPEINEDLTDWWPWLEHYRTWQANREVFLYPENYIEPQLRKNKSPQFAQLESDLQQANLTNTESVDKAFKQYLEGFSQVADLDIVGCAAQQNSSEKSNTLFFVGKTKHDPASYYYMIGTFVNSGSNTNYEPVQWTPWKRITCHMQPVLTDAPSVTHDEQSSPVKDNSQATSICPTFFNGKWYIFWVEEQQSSVTTAGSSQANDDPPKYTRTYTKVTKCAYLDSTGSWSDAKTLKEDKPSNGKTPEYNSVKAETNFSTEQVTVYQTQTNKGDKIVTTIPDRKIQAYPGQVTSFVCNDSDDSKVKDDSDSFTYFDSNGNVSLPSDAISGLSFWVNPGKVTDQKVILNSGDNLKLSVQQASGEKLKVLLNDKPITGAIIHAEKWSHIAPIDSGIVGSPLTNFTDYAFFNNNSKIFVVGTDPITSRFSLFSTNASRQVLVLEGHFKDQDGSYIASFNGQIGLYYLNKRWYVSAIDDKNNAVLGSSDDLSSLDIKIESYSNQIQSKYSPALFMHNDSVSVIWQSFDTSSESGTGGKIKYILDYSQGKVCDLMDIQYPAKHETSSGRIGASTQNGKTIIAWRGGDTDPKLNLAVIDFEKQMTEQKYTGETLVDGPELIEATCICCDSNGLRKKSVNVPVDGPITIDNDVGIQLGTTNFNKATGFQITSLSYVTATNNTFATVDGGGESLHKETFKSIGSSPSVTMINGQRFEGNAYDKPGTQVTFFKENQFKEVLLYSHVISETYAIQLYNNSENKVYGDYVKGYSQPADGSLLVQNQPNWQIIQNSGISALVYHYSVNTNDDKTYKAIRLNTTAINNLNSQLANDDIDGLLSIAAQQSDELPFSNLTTPASMDIVSKPTDKIDLFNGPMSNYYWELFFHAPFLVANSLQTGLQFAMAKKWYQYIFNPLCSKEAAHLDPKDSHSNDRYWEFIGLRAYNNKTLAHELDSTVTENLEEEMDANTTFGQSNLYEYHEDPFDPHAIAHLRPIAYQKVMVMQYINNLIAWGDSLFKQYTIEDINEAEMLYVMAYDLLGKKPVDVASPPLPAVETLNGILALNNRSLDNVHEFLVSIDENQSSTFLLKDNPANYIPGDYFGIPENENFSSYWDTVKQRLYDIRNGLNIDGQKEALPLFQPAISPMQLVAQVASGESLAQALNPLMSMVPYYRFTPIIQKAKEVCATVIQLGQALLSALEKKDAAQLQLLLNLNQQHIQAITMAGKQENINQINASIQALEAGLTSAQQRQQYYQNLISAGLLPKEKTQIALQESAIASQTAANAIRVGAVIMYNIPTVFGFSDGSFQPGSSVSESAAISDGVGGILSASSGVAGTQAGFQRRTEEWNFQADQAENEILQATNQIQSAQYQLRIIQQDMDVTQQRIAQEQKVESFMKNKFTNEQLYEWTIGKVSALYFQAYQFAVELATQAQNSWMYEKGLLDGSVSFIQNGQWDNLHQGLLAGQSLQLDIERMEAAYMKQDERRLEIKKTIALSTLNTGKNGETLIDALNANGSCGIILTEKMFNDDYPDHYCRQIKSVSVSIPAVLGPYENIHATLTQTSNSIQLEAAPSKKMKTDVRANQKIALSGGLNDTGMFQLNFNDERYLPFEGTGAISNWELSIPIDSNPGLVDQKTKQLKLTEVILEIRYTALDG